MKSSETPSILVFRSAALGDFILAAPALAAVREHFPGRHVVLLTTTSGSNEQRARVAAYVGCPSRMQPQLPWTAMVTPHLLDETLVMPELTSRHGLYAARAALRGRRFELAVMLVDPAAPWGGRLKKWLMLKSVAGLTVPVLGWRGRGSLNGNRLDLHKRGVLRHHVHGPMQFLSELKPPRPYCDEDIRFDLRPGKEAETWATEWMIARNVKNKRLVAVAPGSVQPHKRWPEHKFFDLIAGLLKKYHDIAVVIIGSPNDNPVGERLRTIEPARISNIAGVSSISQSAALLAKVKLLVGNDGGAMHLGDAMGCKVVSIIPGIEFPDSIEPWHNKTLAIRHAVECSPCYSFIYCPRGHSRCMHEVSAETVLAYCMTVLD